MQWIIDNKEWLFSGLGITAVSLAIWLFRKINSIDRSAINQSGSKIKAGGNVVINQSINAKNKIPDQIQITLLSLKQMPSRLQESVNSGATTFSFNEARGELEKLYALAKSAGEKDIVASIASFEDNYNQYLSLINQAIKDEVTLDDVNKYQREYIVSKFENEVKFAN